MKRRALMTAAGIVCVAAPSVLAQQFVYNAGSLPAQNIWTNGVELADVDGDGDRDILFANGSSYTSGGAQAQHLFLNNGAGVFAAAHANLNVANFNAQMVIAEDFDGDGDKDLLYSPEGAFPATTQVPRMLINNGSGVFADQSATRIPAITMASFCVCAGDVDNDGDLDVVFTDGGTFGGVETQARLYLNNGAGFFTNAPGNLPADIYNAQDVTLGDWDADFDIDILLTGKGTAAQRSALWLNNGAGTFTATTVLNASGSGNTYEGDPADLDGDGDLDIAMQSISGFSEGWVRNNGATITNTTFSGTNAHDDNEMASFDYDNDGDLDVFVGSLNGSGGEKVYNNNANVFTFAANVIQSSPDSTMDFGFADLNNDRRIDMVTAQGESGNFLDKVYLNNGAADSRVPTVQATQDPAAIGGSGTVYRARIRDAVADDGHLNVTSRLLYATPTASGAVNAINQGCGLMRAVAPTSGADASLSACWIHQDQAGNTTQGAGTSALGVANGWVTMTNGLAGQRGVPVLAGVGANSSSTAGFLGVFGARPNSASALLIGSGIGNVPLYGGTLLPLPIIAQLNTNTNAAGEVAFPYLFPAGVPAGIKIYLQWAISDAAAVQGVSLSNGLELTTN